MIQGVAAKWSFSSLSANKGVNQQVIRFTPFSTPRNIVNYLILLFQMQYRIIFPFRIFFRTSSNTKSRFSQKPKACVFCSFTSNVVILGFRTAPQYFKS